MLAEVAVTSQGQVGGASSPTFTMDEEEMTLGSVGVWKPIKVLEASSSSSSSALVVVTWWGGVINPSPKVTRVKEHLEALEKEV